MEGIQYINDPSARHQTVGVRIIFEGGISKRNHGVGIMDGGKIMKCKITGNNINTFMTFGRMPIANGFVNKEL